MEMDLTEKTKSICLRSSHCTTEALSPPFLAFAEKEEMEYALN